jgi:hypothetical protein
MLIMASIPMDALPFYSLDDTELAIEIFEQQNGFIHFNHDRLISLNYNPLFSSANHRPIFSHDLDPDLHFYENHDNHSDYFIEDQFNEMLKLQVSCSSSFSLLHLNVHSLECNLQSLTKYFKYRIFSNWNN